LAVGGAGDHHGDCKDEVTGAVFVDGAGAGDGAWAGVPHSGGGIHVWDFHEVGLCSNVMGYLLVYLINCVDALGVGA